MGELLVDNTNCLKKIIKEFGSVVWIQNFLIPKLKKTYFGAKKLLFLKSKYLKTLQNLIKTDMEPKILWAKNYVFYRSNFLVKTQIFHFGKYMSQPFEISEGQSKSSEILKKE